MKSLTQIQYLLSLMMCMGLVACSAGELPNSKVAESSEPPSYVEIPGGMVAAKSIQTVRVTTSEDILNSLVSVSGIKSPSSNTMNRYSQWRLLFSDTGDSSSVNAPMWLGILNLSGEICNDLLNQERALPSATRRIFNQIDFTKGPSSLTDAAISDVIRRLARSAWARNETPDEAMAIKQALTVFSGTAQADTTKAMLLTCSAMMASLETNAR